MLRRWPLFHEEAGTLPDINNALDGRQVTTLFAIRLPLAVPWVRDASLRSLKLNVSMSPFFSNNPSSTGGRRASNYLSFFIGDFGDLLMVAFASVLVSLLLAASVACSPVLTERDHGLGINMWLPPFNANGLFCSLPMVPSALCPRQAPPGASVKTPLGTAVGTLSSHGGSRFAVKYGSADRWQNSKVVSSWQLP